MILGIFSSLVEPEEKSKSSKKMLTFLSKLPETNKSKDENKA